MKFQARPLPLSCPGDIFASPCKRQLPQGGDHGQPSRKALARRERHHVHRYHALSPRPPLAGDAVMNHRPTRTGFAYARHHSKVRKRRCTCGEAVRLPDERSEEPCEARSHRRGRASRVRVRPWSILSPPITHRPLRATANRPPPPPNEAWQTERQGANSFVQGIDFNSFPKSTPLT